MIDYEHYLRVEKFPLIWCPGCGHGIVLKAILRAVDRIGLEKDGVAMVSGIGCASRAPGYVDFNTLHTTHGRAITFATGVKMARPDLTVIVATGDGDATAIGGNHFIHAARRNIDMTVVLFNNWIYGMTGGQASPTTPFGCHATTAPYGNPESSFDISGLAVAAGASYVARGTVTQPTKLDRFIEQGIRKRGFALIEAFTPCPTAFGRQNGMARSTDLLQWMKANTITVKQAEKMDRADLDGKLVTGVVADVEKPEYAQQYATLVERLRAEGGQDAPAPARRPISAADLLVEGGVS